MTRFSTLHRAAAALLCVAVVTSMVPVAAEDPPTSTPTGETAAGPPPTIEDAARLQQAGRWEEAAAAWHQIALAEPDNATVWFQLGYALHAAGRLEQAIEAHQKAATFDEYRGIALYNLGCAHALSGNPDQAFEALLASQAAGFQMRGQVEDDSDLDSLRFDPRYEALLANEPAGFEAKLQQILGQMQQLIQQAPQIKQRFAMMAQQVMGKAMNTLGQLQQKMAQNERLAPIAEALGEILGGPPHGAPSQAGPDGQSGPSLEAAAQLQVQGKFLEAAAVYHAVAQATPDDPRPWFGLAYCLHAAGEYEKAIEAHKKAASFDATRGIALYNLACACSLLGRLDEAMEALHASHQASFDLASNIAGDSDLDNLRGDPRFIEFMAELGVDH